MSRLMVWSYSAQWLISSSRLAHAARHDVNVSCAREIERR